MTVLITGGAGFIGTHLIHYWLQTYPDDTVINLDALTYAGNLENHQDSETNPRYRFVKGDITDSELVDALVAEADIVIHAAAETHVDRSILDPMIFTKTNVLGTHTLLEAVRKHNKRFHHISTDEVFGELSLVDPPFSETSPYRPNSPYAASKAASDHLVRSYVRTFGISATISNCSNNYGPYMFPEKIIPLFISHLLENQSVPVYGDGQQVRDWIYVTDHVRGIDMVVRHGTIGETYCLGGGQECTNLDLTKKLIALLGKDESLISFVPDRPGHDRRYAIDGTKVKRELGFTPNVSLDDGLLRTIAWYKEHADWVNRCKTGAYRDYYDAWYTKRQ